MSASVVYLYGNKALLQSVKRGLIPAQPPSFEWQPYAEFDRWQQAPKLRITEAAIIEALQQEYQRLPDNIRGLLTFEDFLQQRDKLEPGIRERLKAQQSTSSSVQSYATQRFQQVQTLRLFSASTCHFGWSHLADDFSGVCIGVKASCEGLQAKPGNPVIFKPVTYGGEHDLQPSADNPVPGLFCDVEEHQKRGEWRALWPASDKDERGLKLKKGDLVSVSVSVSTPDTVLEAADALVQRDIRYRNAELRRVLPDAQQWRLTSQRLD